MIKEAHKKNLQHKDTQALNVPLRSFIMSGSFATSLAVWFSPFRINTSAFLESNSSTSS